MGLVQHTLRLLLITGLLAAGMMPLTAQETGTDSSTDTGEKEQYTRLGVYGGLSFNQHTASFQDVPPLETCCTEYSGGSGAGPAVGLLAGFPIFTDSYLMLRMGFLDLNGSMKETETISNTTLVTEPAVADFNLEAVLSAINLNIEYAYNPIGGLHIYGGTMLGYLMTAEVLSYEQLLSPREAKYVQNNSNIRGNQFEYNDIENKNALQMWLGGGIGYSIPLASINLQPFVRYYFPLTDVAETFKEDGSEGSWSVASFNVGMDAYVELKPKKELIEQEYYIRDTVIVKKAGAEENTVLLDTRKEVDSKEDGNKITETTTVYESYQKTLPLDYSFSATLGGDFQDHAKIIIEETETREAFPLLPYVFFKKGESKLSASSQILLDDEESALFDPLQLEWDALSIHSNLLNIIGKRMTEDPKASITVTGTNNSSDQEKDNLELSRSRAEEVAGYLQKTWGISPDRIQTKARNLPEKPGNLDNPQGQEENSRVEIASSSSDVTGYLNLARIEKTANPPRVEIISNLAHEIDTIPYEYEMSVSQNGKLLRSDKGSGKGTLSDPFRWEIGDSPLPVLEEEIDIELTAKDQYGVMATDSEELKIEQLTIRKKREVLKNDKIVERYSLIVFDYDSAELTPVQKANLRYAKSAITPESTVIVDGHTDNIGTPEYNLSLSSRRIEEVIGTLGLEEGKNVAEIIKDPHGANDPPYPNASPKGRSYNRTVIITILNPVVK